MISKEAMKTMDAMDAFIADGKNRAYFFINGDELCFNVHEMTGSRLLYGVMSLCLDFCVRRGLSLLTAYTAIQQALSMVVDAANEDEGEKNS